MSIKYIIAKIIKKMRIPAIKESILDNSAKVNSASTVVSSKIGKFSYIGNNTTILYTSIGNFCSIADNCIIGGASHPIEWASTSPVFHEGKNTLNKNFSNNKFDPYKRTVIGNDVWIGNSVMIKAGIQIADGAIIGMGSVVTKDIPMFEIWAGNPAKKVRDRFPSEEIKKRLVNSEWWNKSDERISEFAPYIDEIDLFLSKVEE